jgi:hypothetical protein
MNEVIKDISKLTTINEEYLKSLVTKGEWCICSYIEDSVLKKETITKIDIGIGFLSILVEDNTIKYKFIPNKELEEAIRDTIINDKNPLKLKLEKSLVDKITKMYKEYL